MNKPSISIMNLRKQVTACVSFNVNGYEVCYTNICQPKEVMVFAGQNAIKRFVGSSEGLLEAIDFARSLEQVFCDDSEEE